MTMNNFDSNSALGLHRLLFLTKALHTTLTGGSIDQQQSTLSACPSFTEPQPSTPGSPSSSIPYPDAWRDLAAAVSRLGAFLLAFSISLQGKNPEDLSALMDELQHQVVAATNLFNFCTSLGSLRALVYEVTVLTKLQGVVKLAKLSLRRLQDAAQQVVLWDGGAVVLCCCVDDCDSVWCMMYAIGFTHYPHPTPTQPPPQHSCNRCKMSLCASPPNVQPPSRRWRPPPSPPAPWQWHCEPPLPVNP